MGHGLSMTYHLLPIWNQLYKFIQHQQKHCSDDLGGDECLFLLWFFKRGGQANENGQGQQQMPRQTDIGVLAGGKTEADQDDCQGIQAVGDIQILLGHGKGNHKAHAQRQVDEYINLRRMDGFRDGQYEGLPRPSKGLPLHQYCVCR
jgi:hypothetical protein